MKRSMVGILTMGLLLLSLTCGDPQGPLEAIPPTPSVLTVSPEYTDQTAGPHRPGTDGPSVLLSWTPCPDDDFAMYTVFRSAAPNISADTSSADTSFVVTGLSSTTWQDTGVDEGETWYYAVRTTDTEELTAWSNEAPANLPGPTPSMISATYTGDEIWPQITLQWTPCPDPDFESYTLFRSEQPGIEDDTSTADLILDFQDPEELIYEDHDLESLTPYYYVIRTRNEGGESSWGNEAVLGVPELTPTMTVFFIDPSHGSLSGDAILLRTPGNSYYLIDGGDRNSSWSCGADRILPLLDSLGVTELDGMVATHPHADHIGGLIAVLNAMPVGTVWDSGYPYTTQTYYEYLDAIDANGSDYIIPIRGDLLYWDDLLTVECLHPAEEPSDGGDPVNNASIVLRITLEDVSFLFTGDLETDGGEEVILQALAQGYIEDLSADVLKVGHHGSDTSTSPAWLQAVQPSIAAIEVGIGNPYGHPHPTVIQRLENDDVEIHRTDLDGTFILTTDGSTIEVHSP